MAYMITIKVAVLMTTKTQYVDNGNYKLAVISAEMIIISATRAYYCY